MFVGGGVNVAMTVRVKKKKRKTTMTTMNGKKRQAGE
jgi:hypothetical protein